ncbi:MAG: hypothetical protein EZS28_048927, partial [Streblomastix strix]
MECSYSYSHIQGRTVVQLAVVDPAQKVLHELSDQLHAYHVNV